MTIIRSSVKNAIEVIPISLIGVDVLHLDSKWIRIVQVGKMIDALAAAIIIISITRANANSQIEIAKNTIHLIMTHAFSAIKDIF